MADLDALSLLTLHPIDKIVQSGEFSIVNAGAQSFTSPGIQNFPDIRLATDSVPNDYGKPGFIRAVFSVNNINWQPLEAPLLFTYTENFYMSGVLQDSYPLVGVRSQVSIGCDSTNIHARVLSNYFSGNVRIDFNSPFTTSVYSGWTPVSQTIRIKYWMFERE